MDINEQDGFLILQPAPQSSHHDFLRPSRLCVTIEQAIGMSPLTAQHRRHIRHCAVRLAIILEHSLGIRIIDCSRHKRDGAGVATGQTCAIQVHVTFGGSSGPCKAIGIMSVNQNDAVVGIQRAHLRRTEKTQLTGRSGIALWAVRAADDD